MARLQLQLHPLYHQRPIRCCRLSYLPLLLARLRLGLRSVACRVSSDPRPIDLTDLHPPSPPPPGRPIRWASRVTATVLLSSPGPRLHQSYELKARHCIVLDNGSGV